MSSIKTRMTFGAAAARAGARWPPADALAPSSRAARMTFRCRISGEPTALRECQQDSRLERPAGENGERAGLVALRARDSAELQVGEAVDVTALEREGARGAEPDAATDHRRVARGRPVGVGTGGATRAAPQLEGDLRSRVRVRRDAGRRKEGAQEHRHIDVVQPALVGRAGVGDAALRVERLDAEPEHVAAGAERQTQREPGAFPQIARQHAAVRHVAVGESTLQRHAALRRRHSRDGEGGREETSECACHGSNPPFWSRSYTEARRAVPYAAQRIAAITRNTSGAIPWMSAPRRIRGADPARTSAAPSMNTQFQ